MKFGKTVQGELQHFPVEVRQQCIDCAPPIRAAYDLGAVLSIAEWVVGTPHRWRFADGSVCIPCQDGEQPAGRKPAGGPHFGGQSHFGATMLLHTRTRLTAPPLIPLLRFADRSWKKKAHEPRLITALSWKLRLARDCGRVDRFLKELQGSLDQETLDRLMLINTDILYKASALAHLGLGRSASRFCLVESAFRQHLDNFDKTRHSPVPCLPPATGLQAPGEAQRRPRDAALPRDHPQAPVRLHQRQPAHAAAGPF